MFFSWKLISIRIFVNLNVLWMLIFSVKAVVSVVNKTNDRGEDADSSESLVWKWWYQYETTIVMTVIGTIFPFIFELFGFIEKYHPRKTLRIQLGRYFIRFYCFLRVSTLLASFIRMFLRTLKNYANRHSLRTVAKAKCLGGPKYWRVK